MDWQKDTNWIHFTGIGGISVGQLAIAYAKMGYRVTGSDIGIYEPMKSMLEQVSSIIVTSDYNYQNLILSTYTGSETDTQTIPFQIVAGGGLPRNNKELLFAAKRDIPVYNFAQILEQECVVPGKSIVVAGSYGKTTVTSLLISIFREANIDISYMVGAIVNGIEDGISLRSANSVYSVIEGDEYISSRDDLQSKFFRYLPTYLVLTGYAYDHTDVFLTPQDYYNNFAKLIDTLPADGLIVYNDTVEEIRDLVAKAKCKTIPYSYDSSNFKYQPQLIGDFNKLNIVGAAAMARELGVAEEFISAAVAKFTGVKRRLERKYTGQTQKKIFGGGKEIVIIDDFGATPAKSKAAIDTIKAEFPDYRLVTIFEPNIGSRTRQALAEFRTSFENADLVIFPQFANVKQEGILNSEEFAQGLHIEQNKLRLAHDAGLKEVILSEIGDEKTIIAFLSSHGVDEIITGLIQEFDGNPEA